MYPGSAQGLPSTLEAQHLAATMQAQQNAAAAAGQQSGAAIALQIPSQLAGAAPSHAPPARPPAQAGWWRTQREVVTGEHLEHAGGFVIRVWRNEEIYADVLVTSPAYLAAHGTTHVGPIVAVEGAPWLPDPGQPSQAVMPYNSMNVIHVAYANWNGMKTIMAAVSMYMNQHHNAAGFMPPPQQDRCNPRWGVAPRSQHCPACCSYCCFRQHCCEWQLREC